ARGRDPRRAGVQLRAAQQASRVVGLPLPGDALRAAVEPGGALSRKAVTLTELARLGFAELGSAAAALPGVPDAVLPLFSYAADPDQALRELVELRERDAAATDAVLAQEDAARRLIEVLGASEGLAVFLKRHPAELAVLTEPMESPAPAASYRAALLASVEGLTGEDGANALRRTYRRELVRLAAWDLDQP